MFPYQHILGDNDKVRIRIRGGENQLPEVGGRVRDGRGRKIEDKR